MDDANIQQAKLAEQCERYEDMAECMKKVAEESPEKVMTPEARNLFSVAYKNVVGARRSAWRVVNSLADKAGDDNNKVPVEYRKRIEEELKKECDEVLSLLTKIVETSSEADTKVFFYKMKGDYHRYLAEVYSTDESIKTDAEGAYKKAHEEASTLNTCNPIRLGLALNFSVFYYEIMKNPTKAIEMAKKAFDDAIAELDQLQEDSYKDSTLIMQLLRDNLTLWSSENSNEEEEGAEGKEDS